MFGDHFENLQVLSGNALAAHLTTHTHALEDLRGIRTCTNRTRLALTVVLTVSHLTHTTKTVTFYDTLETLTFRSSDYIYEVVFTEEFHSHCIAEIELLIINKFSEMTLRRHTGLLKMTQKRCGNILFLHILEAYLHCSITVGFNSFDLSYYARTAFDNCARHIFAVGTENGSHSDFLS